MGRVDNRPRKDSDRRQFVFDITAQAATSTTVITHATMLQDVDKLRKMGEWISWTQFKKNEGEPVAMSMRRHKKILFELHNGLDANTDIPFPGNQQFKYIRKLEIEDTSVTRPKTMASQAEGDEVSTEDVAFNDMASMSFASSRDMGRGSGDGVAIAGAVDVDMAAGAMSVAQAQVVDAKAKADQELEARKKMLNDKVVVVRKHHTEIERNKREIDATIIKHKRNLNTVGSRFEVDLTQALSDLTEFDMPLVQFEQDFRVGNDINDETIDLVDGIIEQVVRLLKAAQKKTAALNQWFKL